MEVIRQAPADARDEVFIEASEASSGMVWALQTDVNLWPQWRSDVSRAELKSGFNVVSTVREIERGA